VTAEYFCSYRKVDRRQILRLVRGGIASIRDIATAFLAHDESQID
jgi:hypothetical protein